MIVKKLGLNNNLAITAYLQMILLMQMRLISNTGSYCYVDKTVPYFSGYKSLKNTRK